MVNRATDLMVVRFARTENFVSKRPYIHHGPPPSQEPIAGEVWRPVPVPYYASAYEVSSEGRVRRTETGRIRKLVWSGHETWLYRYVSMSYLNVNHSFRVASLVAEAFLGERPADLEVNHKNGNRGDNRVENLEWVTKRENADHAVAHGLPPRGERHGAHKLTEAMVREIRASKVPARILAPKYGISPTTIWAVRLRYHWKHVA